MVLFELLTEPDVPGGGLFDRGPPGCAGQFVVRHRQCHGNHAWRSPGRLEERLDSSPCRTEMAGVLLIRQAEARGGQSETLQREQRIDLEDLGIHGLSQQRRDEQEYTPADQCPRGTRIARWKVMGNLWPVRMALSTRQRHRNVSIQPHDGHHSHLCGRLARATWILATSTSSASFRLPKYGCGDRQHHHREQDGGVGVGLSHRPHSRRHKGNATAARTAIPTALYLQSGSFGK